jgi:hypothetical protein
MDTRSTRYAHLISGRSRHEVPVIPTPGAAVRRHFPPQDADHTQARRSNARNLISVQGLSFSGWGGPKIRYPFDGALDRYFDSTFGLWSSALTCNPVRAPRDSAVNGFGLAASIMTQSDPGMSHANPRARLRTDHAPVLIITGPATTSAGTSLISTGGRSPTPPWSSYRALGTSCTMTDACTSRWYEHSCSTEHCR